MIERMMRLIALVVLATSAASAIGESATSRRGELMWLKCRSCHTLSATETAKTGPTLAGLFGRAAGSIEDYPYSDAMRESDVVWSEATLDAFLAAPFDLVPGNAMAFNGLASDTDRAALLAFLREKTSDE